MSGNKIEFFHELRWIFFLQIELNSVSLNSVFFTSQKTISLSIIRIIKEANQTIAIIDLAWFSHHFHWSDFEPTTFRSWSKYSTVRPHTHILNWLLRLAEIPLLDSQMYVSVLNTYTGFWNLSYLVHNFSYSCDSISYTVKPVYKGPHGTSNLWPLLTGGRCSDVFCVLKTDIGTRKWWSL